ncbi:MAG: hypothetical protein HQ503_03850 [Rhodospirillales bacterium]|nr:hypothetical protein [Rhodospirillales bacterium]
MELVEDRIDPRPEMNLRRHQFNDAEAAFDAGDYASAYQMDGGTNSEIEALAAIMCGQVAGGLAMLGAPESDRAFLVAAYGHWCLGETDQALRNLSEIGNGEYSSPARALENHVAAEMIAVAVITQPGSDKAAGFAAAAGFSVAHISLEPDNFGRTWEDILAASGGEGGPDLIICLDAFGPYRPQGLEVAPAPVVIWSSDHDFFLSTRSYDHAAADIIIANSADECAELSAHYPGRVASFLGHDNYAQYVTVPKPGTNRDLDILFTGRAFASYMRDKAQFLFRLAALDSEDARIEMLEGYLADGDYNHRLGRARYVPTFCRYWDGFQTRSVDAVRAGARVLTNDAGGLDGLLGGGWFAPAGEGWDLDAGGLKIEAPAEPVDSLFWRSPAREERFLKFSLFQSLFTKKRAKPLTRTYIPAEFRGYPPGRAAAIYARIVKMNTAGAQSPVHSNYAGLAAYYGLVSAPELTSFGEASKEIFRAAIGAYPNSLMIRFNAACVLWSFGHKNEASAHFMTVVDQGAAMAFDPKADAIISHRIRAFSELFPYGDFYSAAVGREVGGEIQNPINIMRCGAMTFLAHDAISEGRIDEAIQLLEAGGTLFDSASACWRLLALARAADEKVPADVRQAAYRAINLYPGELPQLLAIVMEAELADVRDGAAAEILKKWTLLAARVKSVDGRRFGVTPENVECAKTYSHLLEDWTLALLTPILDGA